MIGIGYLPRDFDIKSYTGPISPFSLSILGIGVATSLISV